jgi:hypothetical protein
LPPTRAHGHTPPIDVVLAAFRESGFEPVKSAGGWKSRCPGHDDANPSLDIAIGRDGEKVVVDCKSHGCSIEIIAKAVGLEVKNFCSANGNGNATRSRLTPKSNAAVPNSGPSRSGQASARSQIDPTRH